MAVEIPRFDAAFLKYRTVHNDVKQEPIDPVARAAGSSPASNSVNNNAPNNQEQTGIVLAVVNDSKPAAKTVPKRNLTDADNPEGTKPKKNKSGKVQRQVTEH